MLPPSLLKVKYQEKKTIEPDVHEASEQEVADGLQEQDVQPKPYIAPLRLKGGGGEENSSDGEENSSDGEENSSDDDDDEELYGAHKSSLHSESDGLHCSITKEERFKRRSSSCDARMETCGEQIAPTILFHSTPIQPTLRFKNDNSTELIKDLRRGFKRTCVSVKRTATNRHIESLKPETDCKLRKCRLQSKWNNIPRHVEENTNKMEEEDEPNNQEQDKYFTGMSNSTWQGKV